MAASTRVLVSSPTPDRPLMTLETVAIETPACAATVLSVVRCPPRAAGGRAIAEGGASAVIGVPGGSTRRHQRAGSARRPEVGGRMAGAVGRRTTCDEGRGHERITTTPDQMASRFRLSLIHISEPTRRTPISYAVF